MMGLGPDFVSGCDCSSVLYVQWRADAIGSELLSAQGFGIHHPNDKKSCDGPYLPSYNEACNSAKEAHKCWKKLIRELTLNVVDP